MRLTELDPRWLVLKGRRVGFAFRSPSNPEWWQTCFSQSGIRTMTCDACRDRAFVGLCEHSQLGLCQATGIDPLRVQGCNPACGWTIEGGIDAASFEGLTVTPSVDGSRGGLWHGFITGGEIR